MLLFVNHGHPTFERFRDPHLGRLIQPRTRAIGTSIRQTAAAGFPWAADNDGFGGWDDARAERFEQMLEQIAGVPGCRFVTSPDVVGERGLTDVLFEEWAPRILALGLPVAYVLQDEGCEYEPLGIPWGAMDALFIGGADDAWKLGPEVAAIAGEAKQRGKWVHLGRVNSRRRTLYAKSIGCDSIDGTQTSKFPDRWIPPSLEWVREPAPPPTWQLDLNPEPGAA